MTADSRHLATTSSRSASFYAALGLIVLVEIVALHLWIGARHERLAWCSTALGILTLAWLLRDWRGQGEAGLDLGPTLWRLREPEEALATLRAGGHTRVVDRVLGVQG